MAYPSCRPPCCWGTLPLVPASDGSGCRATPLLTRFGRDYYHTPPIDRWSSRGVMTRCVCRRSCCRHVEYTPRHLLLLTTPRRAAIPSVLCTNLVSIIIMAMLLGFCGAAGAAGVGVDCYCWFVALFAAPAPAGSCSRVPLVLFLFLPSFVGGIIVVGSSNCCSD